MKVNKPLNFVYLCVLILILNGCLLTNDRKRELLDEEMANREIINDKKAAQAKAMIQSDRIEKLEASVQELEGVKPQMAKLLTLEQDLMYLVSTLKRRPGSTIGEYQGATTLALNDSLDDAMKANSASQFNKASESFANELSTRGTPESGDDKFSGSPTMAANVENSKTAVELNPAPALLSQTDTINNDSMDKKFSSLPAKSSNLATLSNRATNIVGDSTEDSPSKFSTLASQENQKNLNGTNRLLCDFTSSKSGEISLHLASYHDEDSAKKGWQQLLSMYKDDFCGLEPVLTEVSVKGKNYLSLRLGPIEDKAIANSLCKNLRKKGEYCAPSQYKGRAL